MTAFKHHSRAAAFTLVEIIVVLAIVTIVVTTSVPYISGILTASRLRTAADSVYNRLLEAQSLAMLLNTDTELRLYEVPDLIETDKPGLLRKLRLFTLTPPQDTATGAGANVDVFEPVGSVTNLEDGITVSSDPNRSSILKLGFQPPGSDSYGQYIALRFRADGSVGLQPGQQWFLTLHEKDAELRGPKLKNFVTLQIDPTTGRLRTFQP